MLRRRILSIIALCSIVWLASVWLAAGIAQAQESLSNDRSLTATERAFVQRSIEKPQAPHLLLSMVDRNDREPAALRNSGVQVSSLYPTDGQNPGQIRLLSNPQGAEFASLAALASAPPPSLLNSIRAKDLGLTDTSSHTNDEKALVYQLGKINLVVNQLPDCFSVSSPGNSLPDAR